MECLECQRSFESLNGRAFEDGIEQRLRLAGLSSE
jgi:hypothetical protein